MEPKKVQTKRQSIDQTYCLKWILKSLGYIPCKNKDEYLFSLGYNLDMVLLGKLIDILGENKDYAKLQTLEAILKSNLEKLLIVKKDINTTFFKKDVELNPILGQTMDEMVKKINQPAEQVKTNDRPQTRPRFK
jgi:hypothetical protein